MQNKFIILSGTLLLFVVLTLLLFINFAKPNFPEAPKTDNNTPAQIPSASREIPKVARNGRVISMDMYSLSIPKSWKIKKLANVQFEAIEITPPQHNSGNLLLVRQDFTNQADFDKVIASYRALHLKQESTNKLSLAGIKSFGNLPEYDPISDSIRAKSSVIYAVHDDLNIFIITYFGWEGVDNSNLNRDFEDIISTIKLN